MRFRLGAHDLRVVTGPRWERFVGNPRHACVGYVKECTDHVVEDQFHTGV